jgi:uncharacterized protein (DUF924 family)
MENPASIHAFWFGEDADDSVLAQNKSRLWWAKDSQTDLTIAKRFSLCTAAAAAGQLDQWAATAQGQLALILLLDQFPRNMYRGLPKSFSFDAHALRWSLQGLADGVDQRLRPIERVFFYLPLEHAESLQHQDHAVQLFEKLLADVPPQHKKAFAGFLQFAQRHRDVIARFGRFPHRNAILERACTDDERAFLKTPGSSF